MFRRRPGGIEFSVPIEDDATRAEVQEELHQLGISAKVNREGRLVIEARGESAPGQVRKILVAHGLRPPASAQATKTTKARRPAPGKHDLDDEAVDEAEADDASDPDAPAEDADESDGETTPEV